MLCFIPWISYPPPPPLPIRTDNSGGGVYVWGGGCEGVGENIYTACLKVMYCSEMGMDFTSLAICVVKLVWLWVWIRWFVDIAMDMVLEEFSWFCG